MNKFYFNPFLKLLITILIVLILGSCSIRKIVVNQLSPVVDEMQLSILEESEEILVEQSLPFAIKFAESLYRYYPDYPYYSGKLAMLYAAYTFAYFDDTPYDDFDEEADMKIQRLLKLYGKSYDFGLKSLENRIPGFSQNIKKLDEVDELLKKVELEDVETLYWFSFSWAMGILYKTSDTSQTIHLETIKKIADRIQDLHPNYFAGANNAIYIAYYGARVDTLGGNKKKAKEYYLKDQKINSKKSLINDFVYFRFVTTQSSDPREFEKIYQKIKAFDIEQSPSFKFINTFLKRKAKFLYQKKDKLF